MTMCGDRSHPPRRVAVAVRAVAGVAACAAWIAIALFGWNSLLRHTYQPAGVEEGATNWPDADRNPTSAAYTVVVFAHPLCPCTRATLNKLHESITRFPDDRRIEVIFATAGLDSADVADSFNVRTARRLEGVEVRFDETGEIVRRFGATVSGEVFAFDREGRRVFHGGITTGRGHEGDSTSQREFERRICGRASDAFSAPVYGCLLPLNPVVRESADPLLGRANVLGRASTDR